MAEAKPSTFAALMMEAKLNTDKTDWSPFSETNDYSRGTNTSYADSTRITVYVNGVLVRSGDGE